ncbi:MAG: MFS transporter [Nocardioides sp.]
MSESAPDRPRLRVPLFRPPLLLSLAAVAVAFAAADTYVVVLALPEMMTSVGVPLDQLQRAAPIVSGFLLGYIAMLPLIGRISDLRGRVPVLIACLISFAFGSLVTALAYDLPSLVSGRFLQGAGAGGLVPVTLALVADLYPPQRRGVPLGLVSGVQELGSVLGPLFGAAVVSVSTWRSIFAVNLAVALVLAAAIVATRSEPAANPAPRLARVDLIGAALGVLALLGGILVFIRPSSMMRDLRWGTLFVPYVGSGRWLTPLGLLTVVMVLLFTLRCLTARTPVLKLNLWWQTIRRADLPGSALLASMLAGVIAAFGTADPRVAVFSPNGGWYLAGSALAAGLLVMHVRRSPAPLLPPGTLRHRAAWGSLAVSFLIGTALIAALIDIPIFARTTIYSDSQLDAALVLTRFLIALPFGAVIGGALTRRISPGIVTAVAMALVAGGFVGMSRWTITSLGDLSATITLGICGFGFGLALAPVNAALLTATDAAVHGVATALLVVARMMGMLVGISALTVIGLRRYYLEQRDIPPVREVCDGRSRCAAFTRLLQEAGIVQEQAVFAGAAICAAVAGALALVVLRTRYASAHAG